jgi:cellulose synthase/poly-beta-1,6-N-acetylglucosamine synthase-like glycosyltransferase
VVVIALLWLLTLPLLLVPAISLAGWYRLSRAKHSPNQSYLPVFTILIPFRNEANRILPLLHSLVDLKYPVDKLEILFLNDHSEDGGEEEVIAWGERYPWGRCVNLTNTTGKKAALELGVSMAKGEVIVTTDADCKVPAEWLSTYASVFSDPDIVLAPGLVAPDTTSADIRYFMVLEMAALTGVSAGMAAYGKTFTCNGGNLAYRKKVFEQVNGYQGNRHVASGDDEFLLNKVQNLHPYGVRYVTDTSGLVRTKLPQTWSDFYFQRIRWSSKWNKNSKSRWMAPVVALAYGALAGSWIVSFLNPSFLFVTLMITGLKVLLDFLLIQQVMKRWKIFPNPVYFLVSEFLYPLYVLVFGILAQRKQYVWKGRRYEEALTKEY